MIRDYLRELKTKGNFTFQAISDLSGISEPTIRKIFSGETADPRFDTVVKLVTVMGGSFDVLSAPKKVEEIEANAIIALKESYEARFADLKEQVESLKRGKRLIGIVCGILASFLILLLILDLCIGSHGWILY